MIVGNLEIRLMADIARLQRDMNAGRQVVSNAAAGMERAANAARTALASIGAGLIGGMGLSQIMRMTDEYTKFTAQLKLGTNSQKEYAQAMEDVKRISTAAQNDIGATGVLYARIIASTRELGVTQAQVAKVTETVNLALAATGAGSAESASAMLQLSQAFGSGVLRGEEFNAVYEAAPELLRILAKSMGIPIGQLRKLAEEGKLTSDKLVVAFSDNQVINKLRENVAEIKTFSGAMTVFKNNLTEIIGEQLHASGVVATFTSAITEGAKSIKTMLDVLVTATKVGAAYVALLVIAPPLITATAAAMTRLGHAMAVYAMNVMIGQANTIKFNQTLFGTSVAAGLAAGAITRVGLALNGVFALYLGWQIGTYLNDQFVEVEIAAEVMTGELLKAWEVIKFAFKDAFDAITLTAREGIAFLSRGMAGWFGLVADGMRLIGKTDAAAGVDKLAASVVAATEVQGTYTSRSAAARAEMEKNIKIIDLDTDRRSNAALVRRALVEANERSDGRAAAGAAAVVALTKEQIAEAKRQAAAYRDLTRSLQDRVDTTAREAAGLAPLTVAEKAHLDLTRQITDGKLKLNSVQEASARSLINEAGANDVLIKSNAEWAALQQQLADNARQVEEANSTEDSRVLLDINARIAATKQEIDLYGAGAAAVTAAEATKVRAMAGSMAITEQYREQLLLQADALDRLGEMQGVKSDLDALFDTGRVETFGEALRNAFGEAGSSMAQLGGALQEYVSKQANAEKDIAAVKLKYGKDDVRAARDIAKIQERMEADRIGAYGDMAGAAKGFFSEGTTGYKLMAGAEKAFRAVELASQMQSLYTHLFVTTAKATGTTAGQAVETTAVIAGETARNTAKVPGVFMAFMSALGPWGMAAAGVAIAAVLGGAFSGGGGVDLSVQRQELQGTGSVLGSDDKSESIARALDAIEGVSVQGLAISNGMLASLRNIEAGITQFASLLVRTTGVTGEFGAGIANRGSADAFGSSTLGVMATGGPIGLILDKITGGWVGKITGSILGKIFGGKTTVEDTGFTAGKTDFAGIAAGGLNAMQFADIKKEGGWFSKDKTSVQTQSLGEEGNRQIASVLMSLYDTVLQAGTMLGLGADGFAAQLNSFVVDIGKISLKGLSDDEIEKELSAVFSKVGDDLAKFGVDGLGQFQKVGEGYLETLSRVATNYQAVTVVTDSMGMTFSAVGLASVGARERLIDLVGGLDEFTSSADQFLADFYTDKERADSLRARITPTLDQYGIKTGAEDSLKQFRDVMLSLDPATEEGARGVAKLLQIAPVFKQIADVDASVFEERADLQSELDELVMSSVELLAKQRDALDESNRSLFDQIQAVTAKSQAEAAAAERASAVLAERKSLQDQLDQLTLSSVDLLAQQRGALDESNRALFDSVRAAEAAKAANEAIAASMNSYQDQIDAMNRAGMTLEQQRALEIASLDATVVPLAQQLHAMQDQATAASAAATALEAAAAQTRAVAAEGAGLDREFMQLMGDTAGLRKLELEGLDPLNRAKKQEIYDMQDRIAAAAIEAKAIEEAARAQQDAANQAADAASQIRSAWQSVTDSVFDEVARIRGLLGESTGTSMAEAQMAFSIKTAQARAGDQDAAKLLPGLSRSLLDLAEANSLTSLDLRRFQAQTMGSLSDTAKMLSGQFGLSLPSFAVGTNYLPYDMIAQLHEGERIIPKADNLRLEQRLSQGGSDTSALEAAVDRLTAKVADQQSVLDKISRNTQRSADTQDRLSDGGEAVRVRVQAEVAA